METLKYEQLHHGGFAGLEERQFVTDSRVFGHHKRPEAWNGIGNFVYLADAEFNPHGETRMHPHREVDVISVMVKGRIAHEGSLEHGEEIRAGQVQVQRAGGEGFRHNEVNPDDEKNQMIQLWVLPDDAGEPAGYQVFEPTAGERTRILGGERDNGKTLYGKTAVEVLNANAGDTLSHGTHVMAYLSKGSAIINGETIEAQTMVRSKTGITFEALEDAQLIFMYED